jgi:hypothetical protein
MLPEHPDTPPIAGQYPGNRGEKDLGNFKKRVRVGRQLCCNSLEPYKKTYQILPT